MLGPETIFQLTDAQDEQKWGSYYNPDNVTFMQYTGLKDRHGKDIYEGDVVAVSGLLDLDTGQTETDLCVVEYEGPSLMYIDVDRNDSNSVESIIGGCSQDEDAEVVGNVWENPELLKP